MSVAYGRAGTLRPGARHARPHPLYPPSAFPQMQYPTHRTMPLQRTARMTFNLIIDIPFNPVVKSGMSAD